MRTGKLERGAPPATRAWLMEMDLRPDQKPPVEYQGVEGGMAEKLAVTEAGADKVRFKGEEEPERAPEKPENWKPELGEAETGMREPEVNQPLGGEMEPPEEAEVVRKN